MRLPTQELFEKYQNNLYAVAFNVCKNAEDAEDVVQDTFIQYYSFKKQFDNEQHIRAWLIRVAINKAKNMNLPEKYRIVIHLFYFEDYTIHEIAKILKLSEGNVRLSRARSLLREKLQEEWENDE